MMPLSSQAQQPHIGSDETLKGDTFGGLVVCGCYLPNTEDFLLLGVKDSKELSEKRIREIAQLLLSRYAELFAVEEIEPLAYNDFTKQHSVTVLLNKLHEQVAQTLRSRHGNVPHLVDAFPGCSAGDTQLVRGEQVSLAIAAASVVARYKGLLQFERLSTQAKMTLPLGSTHVQAALHQLVRQRQDLKTLAKLHFKNVSLAMCSVTPEAQKRLSDGF